MNPNLQPFSKVLEENAKTIDRHLASIQIREMGKVVRVGRGVVEVNGLREAQNDELLRFPNDQFGFVFNLDPESMGCVLLENNTNLVAGDEVRRTHRALDVPVGEHLLGRVIDPVGRPLDGGAAIESGLRWPVERPAAPIMNRAPVSRPLQTGIKVIDALVPIGRGQRQLVIGDRQTGKTSVVVDTIVNQRDSDVVCVYCAIGQRSSSVSAVVDRLRQAGALNHCVVVVGESDATAGLQFVAPYAAMSIGEWFLEQGRDVLVVFDELTAHAKAFREMSLLLRRPPGREAFPGDIFYVHARLLERATSLRPEEGGGSLTALPVIETESQQISAYIPTNLISITDGQVYLSPDRFRKGILPAVDVGRSVSRVGGKAQLAAYRSVTGPLRLAYAQFEELERFSRFSSQLDETTRQKLRRGQRVRQLLKQAGNEPKDVVEQVVAFLVATHGLFDEVPNHQVHHYEDSFNSVVKTKLPDICQSIRANQVLSKQAQVTVVETARQWFAESAPKKVMHKP
ncbi:MAG: F0F1 ATP synthase subunit alpha [Planctomycetota bacterium]